MGWLARTAFSPGNNIPQETYHENNRKINNSRHQEVDAHQDESQEMEHERLETMGRNGQTLSLNTSECATAQYDVAWLGNLRPNCKSAWATLALTRI